MEKNICSIEQKCCVACTKLFDSGALLLQTRRIDKPMLDRNTVTGWDICPACKTKIDEGFVILVGCDPDKSTESNGRCQPEDVYRTGEVIFVRDTVARQMFNEDVKTVAFVDQQVVSYLKQKFDEIS